jgi:hypothetical protein
MNQLHDHEEQQD